MTCWANIEVWLIKLASQTIKMALAGRRVQVQQDGDVAVGRVVDTVIDPRSGLVAERERVAVQVPTRDGGTALLVGEKIRAVHVPNWIQSNIADQRVRPPAIGSGRTVYSGGDDDDDDQNSILSLFRFCCVPCFLPCAVHKLCLAIWQLIVFIAIACLIGFTAAGPLNCSSLRDTSIVTFVLLGIILCISIICICFVVCQGEDKALCQCCLYCCAAIFGFLFLGFVIAGSVMVFREPTFSDVVNKNSSDCNFIAAPIATMSFSYGLILLFSCCWICCCCVLLSVAGSES